MILEIHLALAHYNAQLSLLLQVSQTRLGATHILNVGLFNAIRQSQLFAADPDIGVGEYSSKLDHSLFCDLSS
jgi:nuclear pore complex protein Nup205